MSQQPHLYAYQLAKCPSFSAGHRSFSIANIDGNTLPWLRRLFAREVKRNIFHAYLRPNETVIKLVSNSISSSSCPGGEGLQFSPSPKGKYLLAFNSSRIYVLDATRPDLDVKRELKILRRPSSACITDDGNLLTVLSTDMQVDLYDLTKSPPKRMQSLILDHSPRTIAISPCGTVLAAAYDSGIEVSSLNHSALPTDRRAVKCDAVDALAFSLDGTQLMGTTVYSNPPSTVILTAPYYNSGNHMPGDSILGLWTTSILFPNTSRDCSHAVLLQDLNSEEAYWILTYDRSFETFRAVHVDDLRNGTTYFTGPAPMTSSPSKLLPCTLPAATYDGDIFSAGFQGKEIWIYGVPEKLDAIPDQSIVVAEGSPNSLGKRSSSHSIRPISRVQGNPGARPPQWQVLCDKLRHTFVAGVKVAELDGVSLTKWVGDFGMSSMKERLIIAAKAMPPKPVNDDIDFADGGRIILLDFDYGLVNGIKREVIIEVGTKKPEILEEEYRDMDTEVAIVRRRTVAQRRGNQRRLSRTATAVVRPFIPSVPAPANSAVDDNDPLEPRRIEQLEVSASYTTDAGTNRSDSMNDSGDAASIEELEVLDAPYSHTSPRSGTTLRRAATAAAINRNLHTDRRYEYSRADGRREHPHESDADNWVPPPPPYQKEDPHDLPLFLRHAIIDPARHMVAQQVVSVSPQSTSTQGSRSVPPQQQLGQGRISTSQTLSHQQVASQASAARNAQLQKQAQPRGANSGSVMHPTPVRVTQQPLNQPLFGSDMSRAADKDSLYDISPPDSPTGPARSVTPVSVTRGRIASGHLSIRTPSVMSLQRDLALMQQVVPTQAPSVSSSNQRSLSVPQLPQLNLSSPSLLDNSLWYSSNSPQANLAPSARRLSNSQAWPKNPTSTLSSSPTNTFDYPYSAPAGLDITYSSMVPSHTKQAAKVVCQQDGTDQQLHSTFINDIPVGCCSSSGRENSNLIPISRDSSPLRRPVYHEPDQPLIVSTPAGVQGVFDPPRHQVRTRSAEMKLFAPVPRHPRPTLAGPIRPTVERLEGIYNRELLQQSRRQGGDDLLSTLNGNSLTGSAPQDVPVSLSPRRISVNRRQSRATRSAQKNLADAKKKGWSGTKRQKKKLKESDAVSSTAWTDASRNSADRNDERDKRCILM